ncbi:hypothetical protein TNCV_4190161 [Trichonephila clavipes]|nr:hypothetical protein TNCV_4190161 [Trichonephila clavipes]
MEVSEELTQSVISRLWQQFQDDGNVSRRYNTEHPQVTTPNEDRCLAVTPKRNRRYGNRPLPSTIQPQGDHKYRICVYGRQRASSILTWLESSTACVAQAWPTSFIPSIMSKICTGTLEKITF